MSYIYLFTIFVGVCVSFGSFALFIISGAEHIQKKWWVRITFSAIYSCGGSGPNLGPFASVIVSNGGSGPNLGPFASVIVSNGGEWSGFGTICKRYSKLWGGVVRIWDHFLGPCHSLIFKAQ